MAVTKKVKVKYELGHTMEFVYELDKELYCPICGSKGVWVESFEGDFYVGPDYVCTKCGTSYNLPCSNKADEQVIKQLVSG